MGYDLLYDIYDIRKTKMFNYILLISLRHCDDVVIKKGLTNKANSFFFFKRKENNNIITYFYA